MLFALGLGDDVVREIAEEIAGQPMVIAHDPDTVGEVLGDARTMAQATDTMDARPDPRIIEALELHRHMISPELVAIPGELAAWAIELWIGG